MPTDPDSIVCHVRSLPAEARAAYLDKACAGDAALRAQLETKLAELAAADGFFAQQETILSPERRAKEVEGAMIGPYKLLQQIGEGGFGTVWMAEQQHPVRRRVALKIIKAGMDTKQVTARFEQERQALAMMDHPNIAQVFDAGSTETGRPYFVMELVKGIPITKFCDEQKLGTRERLLLFADVCAAINHAHQKGIIHRDIKPTNVMVTLHGEKAVPKVIDFGIAKATQHKLTDQTLFTRFEQFIGTPVYMSPEQAALSGLDIDTRSDIYALGILLYELLTGRPPFDAQSLVAAGYDEMRRIIREVEPPRPSSRLNTVAGDERTALALARHISPDKISRLVEPDLDWIVMKAIEKDRARRYETANAFALDIKHFLADEPVSASPPGARYLLKKFARRHRMALRVAAVIALLLVAATVVSTLLMIRAREAEDEVTRRLEQVKSERDQKGQVLQFVTRMLQSPDPKYSERNITVIRVLDRAAGEIGTAFAGQPLLQAGQRGLIGGSYSALGDTDKAIPLQEQALDFHLHAPEFGPEHQDTIQAQAALAWTYDFATRRKESIPLQRTVLAWYQRHREPGHPDISQAMATLGRGLHFDGQEAEGLRLQEEAVRLSSIRPGRATLETMPLLHWLAVAYENSKDEALREKGAALDVELYDLCQKLLRPDHPDTLRARHAVASRIKDGPARVAELRELERLGAIVNGPDHPYTLCFTLFRLKAMRETWANNAGLRAKGGGDAALDSWGAEALAGMELLQPRIELACGPDHAETLWATAELASWLQDRWKVRREGDAAAIKAGEDDRKRALELWQKTARLSNEALEQEHYDAMGRKAKLAEAWDYDGQPERARVLREEILPLYLSSEKFGPRDGATDWVRRGLIGNYVTALKQPGLAAAESATLRERLLTLLKDSVEYWRTAAPADDVDRRAAEKQYALALQAAGRAEDAAPLFAALGMEQPRALRKVRAVIVPPDSEWKWLHPTDGTDPGFQSQFAAPEFPDSTWGTARDSAAAAGGFGYAKDLEMVIGKPLEGHRFTAYFRHHFKAAQDHARIELRCRCDDGIIVYLDGTEVARHNMPAAPAPATHRLFAREVVNEPADIMLPLPALTRGGHCLAISLHNVSGESSDLHLGGITLVEVEEK